MSNPFYEAQKALGIISKQCSAFQSFAMQREGISSLSEIWDTGHMSTVPFPSYYHHHTL